MSCLLQAENTREHRPKVWKHYQLDSYHEKKVLVPTKATVPRLALLLKSPTAIALESDLGILMVGLRHKIVKPEGVRTTGAKLVVEVSNSKPPGSHKPCISKEIGRQVKAVTLQADPQWLKEFPGLSATEQRGFVRALLNWALGIHPDSLPEIPFARLKLTEMFNTTLHNYCEKYYGKGNTPATNLLAAHPNDEKI